MIAVLIQIFRFENPTTLPAPRFQDLFMLLDILTRLEHVLTVNIRANAFEAEALRDSGPALAHARRAGLVCDIEQLTASALLRVQGSPDGELRYDVCGSIFEEGIVGRDRTGKRDFGAFSLDKSVQGEVGSPVGWEVEGAAVGDEADLFAETMRMRTMKRATVECTLYLR